MASGQISDDAVRKKTGKGWGQWFTLLDKAGAKEMDHKHVAAHLSTLGVPGWWCQMIAVTYEQDRGLRKKHQMPDGYSVGVSRTFDVPIGSLYSQWSDSKLRNKWLKEKIIVRKETKNKSMRITWPDNTSVELYFTGKAPDKSQVAVQHSKLAKAADVERSRVYWKAALDRLSKSL
jgi:hypothetical protein